MTTTAHRSASPSAAMAMTWALLLVVAVVPLLLDLSNVDDTYYGLKARALLALAAVIGMALLADPALRPALIPHAAVVLPFGGAAVASTVFSVSPLLALSGSSWRHEGLFVFLAYLVVCVGSAELVRRRPGPWLWALLSGTAVVAAYGVAQYLGAEWLVRDPVRAGWVTAFGTTGHPNYFGSLMVLVGPFAAAACLTARKRAAVIAGGALTLLLILGALTSFSRAAWSGMVLAAALMTVLVHRRPSVDRSVGRGAVLLGSFVAIIVLFFLPGGPLGPRDGSSALARAGSIRQVEGKKVADRLYLWKETARLVLRRPILGYGPDTLAVVLSQEWDERRRELWGPAPRIIDKAHNDTLDMLVSFGIVGLLAYWRIIAEAVRSAVRVMRSDPARAPWAAAGLCGLAGYLFALQFGFSVVSVAPVFWSVLGATIGLSRGGGP